MVYNFFFNLGENYSEILGIFSDCSGGVKAKLKHQKKAAMRVLISCGPMKQREHSTCSFSGKF